MKANIVIFIIFSFTSICRAENVMNTCWDANGQNNFSVVFTSGEFTSGKAGATAQFRYVLPSYPVSCWTNIDRKFSYASLAYQSKTNLLSAGGSYLKVNDDFDVMIFTSARTGGMVPTISTSLAPYDRIDFSRHQGYFPYNTMFGGGIVTVRLRRDQLGGALHIPPGALFSAHSSLTSFSDGGRETQVRNLTPIVTVSTADQYIPLPVVCQINNSMAIEVDFGDIDNTKISRDGSRYIRTVPLRYSCNTPITQNININLVAAPASFSSDVIASSLPDDIGVMVKYNGELVKPNDKFDTTLVNGMGQDQLQVAPVINDPTKSVTGGFTASATLIMTVQ
ncbi:TPA: fimbrial protein [Serratia marcescens]